MTSREDNLLTMAEKKKKARKRRRGPYRKAWSPKISS
jgi:hypothetical protein